MIVLPIPFGLMLRRPDALPKIFEPDSVRIRCPKCGWQPLKEDTWLCSPGCGHVWNTFDTSGVCPGCAKHWAQTACLRCGVWSPHDDWYARQG